MKLRKLLQNTGADTRGYDDVEVGGLAHHPEDVRPRDLFVCLNDSDGAEELCRRAAELGAAAAVAEREIDCDMPVVTVPDVRAAFAIASSNLYGEPCKKLKVIAVVGTNGKSTTAYLIHGILERCGYRAALIGTMYCEYRGERIASRLTTPDPPELHALFAKFADAGAEYVVIEVSAHAIYFRKLAGVRAEVAVFTNFSRDHLDFFKEMEIYKRTKMSYFDLRSCKCAVVNADDECGAEILAQGRVPSLSYGLENPCDVFAVNIERTDRGTRFVVNMMDEIVYADTRLRGRFNVYNCLAACTAARLVGADADDISHALHAIAPPEGRYNVIRDGGVDYVIDFAHTPDGLQNLLTAAREDTRGKLICVFGCGGDRDVSKRPIMGEIASRLADEVIVTSDNPRTEDRAAIAEDIVAGIKGSNFKVVLDREVAIVNAVLAANSGDCVVIAGKGSEAYIDEHNVKTPYSDFAALDAALAAKGKMAG